MTYTVPIPVFSEAQNRRFWAKVDPTGFCWNWTGGTVKGYGAFNAGSVGKFQSHRIAYTMLLGQIPKGLEIDHLCRNTLCVNPDHLEPVTREENQRRIPNNQARQGRPPWVVSGKDVTGKCIRGHEYTEMNTYTYKDGRTECRTCKKINAANYRARRRALTAA